MPFVAAPNIIEMEFRYLLFGQKCENRIMVDNLGPVDATDLQQVATIGWNWWELEYAPLITSQLTLASVVTTDLSAIDGGQYTYAPDTTTTGTGGSSAMPNETSLCLSLRTGNRGRSARGRWFMAGIPNDQMATANNVEVSYANAASLALSTLNNNIDDSGRLDVVVSFITAGAPRVGGPVYYPITSVLVVDTIVDSQRRRKPGVGE